MGQSLFEDGLAFEVHVVSGQGGTYNGTHLERLNEEQVDELLQSDISTLTLCGSYKLGFVSGWRIRLDLKLTAEAPKPFNENEILYDLEIGDFNMAAQRLSEFLPGDKKLRFERTVERQVEQLR